MALEKIVSKEIKIAHFNVGFLMGPVTGKRRNYHKKIAKIALTSFIPETLRNIFSSRTMTTKTGFSQMTQSIFGKSTHMRLRRIVRYINDSNIDVLTLNEADLIFPGVDQVRAIQKMTQLKHAVHVTCFGAQLGGWGVARNGNAILSRYPFSELESGKKMDEWYIDQPDPYVYTTQKIEELIGLRVGNWGRRLMRVRVNFGDDKVGDMLYNIVCTHLHDQDPYRTLQAECVKKIIEEEIGPCISGADWNSSKQWGGVSSYGDIDEPDSGKPLAVLRPIVDMDAIAREYTMFNGGGIMQGTYPVVSRRRKGIITSDPKKADRHYDHILPFLPQDHAISEVRAQCTRYRVRTDVVASDHYPVEVEAILIKGV